MPASRRTGVPCGPVLRARLAVAIAVTWMGLVHNHALGQDEAVPEPQPTLALPINCDPGSNCWIGNYVDVDSGPGAGDYACGVRTYDGHKGTDFAIRDLAVMRRGVEVLAAAPGSVKAVRDGMTDIRANKPDREGLKGRECGNGVIVDHGGDLETQYCHMRRGSVKVQREQRVERGDVLGLVGLSGFTQFPHLHITVRHSGVVVDPFIGSVRTADCVPGPNSLWHEATMALLPYRPFVIYNAGFAGDVPAQDAIARGAYHGAPVHRLSEGLVLWMEAFGVEPGD